MCGLLATWSALVLAWPTVAGPIGEELRPVVATVTVLSENGQPMEGMLVSAVQHEFGLRVNGQTDPRGVCLLKVMPGTWSLFATATFDAAWKREGHAYYLASGRTLEAPQESITLRPDTTVHVELVSDVFDFSARENYVDFVSDGYGRWVDTHGGGVTRGASLVLHSSAGLRVQAAIHSPRGAGEILEWVQPEAVPLVDPLSIVVTALNSSVLEVDARGPTGAPAHGHCQLSTLAYSWSWAPFITDLELPVRRLRAAPGRYVMLRAADGAESRTWRMSPGWAVIALQPGQVQTVHIGGPLSQAYVRTTPRAAASFKPATQLLVHMQDSFGNPVVAIDGAKARFAVREAGGETEASATWPLIAKWSQEFDRARAPTYEVALDLGPWGSSRLNGDLYGVEERRRNVAETDLIVLQAPLCETEVQAHRAADYQRLAEAMEKALGVPMDSKTGIIDNIIHAGFEDEVLHGYKLEVGIEADRPSGWDDADGFAAHEAGHGRTLLPPTSFAAFSRYGESYSTLVGYRARSLMYGGEARMAFLLGSHGRILDSIHGTVPAPLSSADAIELMQFATNYIYARFGWAPHERMIVEWANAFRPLRERMASAGFTEAEQFAATYSWLCGTNLGELFRSCAPDTRPDRVEAATSILRSYCDEAAMPEVSLGSNVVRGPGTSVAIRLHTAPSRPVRQVSALLTYDPGRASITGVMPRDLSLLSGWKVESTSEGVPEPSRQVRITASGEEPVSGLGSVLHIRMDILPAASGSASFRLDEVRTDLGPCPPTAISIALPDEPLIHLPATLPPGRVGAAYRRALEASCGTPPYRWEVVEDGLPPGLAIDPGTGTIAGTCTQPGVSVFRLRVTDAKGAVAHRWYEISVGE